MSKPTLAQQRWLAFAPLPFAILSSVSCAYVILYHLVINKRQKLNHLYHRLVLAMAISMLALSLTWIWAPFAVPNGSDGYVGASGTVGTCTASAFLLLVFSLTVPIYYSSLILQAFLGIRSNFKEDKYVWIEKWVHVAAYGYSITVASVYAATDNLNPAASGCSVAKAPLGCEEDPNISCETGENITGFDLFVGFSLVFLIVILPLAIIILIYRRLRRLKQTFRQSNGWLMIQQSARKEMMQSIHKQILLYLFSFWFTWVFFLVNQICYFITKELLYNFLIFDHCVYHFQGCVFAIVYFWLEEMNKPKAISALKPKSSEKNQMTVESIRFKATSLTQIHASESKESAESDKRLSYSIFTGVPDENSPWAQYFDEDEDDYCNDDAYWRCENDVGTPDDEVHNLLTN